VATAERVRADLVDTVATVAVLTCDFFESFYAVNELAEVRPYGNSVDLVHLFTDKSTRVDCNGWATLEWYFVAQALPRAVRECIMMRQIPNQSLLTFIIALLAAAHTASPAWAWGRLGHRVISRLAEKDLTPKATGAIKALLDERESLADASTCADEHRGRASLTPLGSRLRGIQRQWFGVYWELTPEVAMKPRL
jgi:hypothetical protein